MTGIFRNLADPARVTYDADGTSRDFPFGFAVFDAADIVVRVGDEDVSSGFHIALKTPDAGPGGVVRFESAPASGAEITLRRRLHLRRLSRYDSGSSLRADALNHDFDYMLAALGDVGAGMAGVLTLPDGEAGKSLIWDESGQRLINGADGAVIAGAQQQGQLAAAAALRAETAQDRAQTALQGFMQQGAGPVLALDCRAQNAVAYEDERRMKMIDAPGYRVLDRRETGAFVMLSNGGRADLPSCAAAGNGVWYRISNGDGTLVDIRAQGADILRPADGSAERAILTLPLRGDAVDVMCDGQRWHILPVRFGGPVVKLRRVAAQNIPADGDFIIEWDSVPSDTHNLYDAAIDGINHVPPGHYHLDIGVCFELTGDAVQGMVYVERLGAGGWSPHLQGIDTLPAGPGARKIVRCGGIIRAGIGVDNAFRVRAVHGSDDSRVIPASDLQTWFHLARIGA
ncbi:MAG: hypothetical protein ABID63_10760 [Pseudomonadota bacterium]